MGKKKDDDEERSPLAKFVIVMVVIAAALVGLRLVLDALGWWSGDPASLTAKIGVGLLVVLGVVLWVRHKLRKRG